MKARLHKHCKRFREGIQGITFIFCLFPLQLIAQKANSAYIDDVTFGFNGENVEIIYDIEDARPDAVFAVSIEIYRAPDELLEVYSLNGDIGKEVRAGSSKKIIWESRKDGYVLDDDVYVKVKATTNAQVPVGSHIIKSVIIPGFGDYRICKGNYHFLYGVAAYGSVAAAIYLNSAAYSNRQNYLVSMDIGQRNDFYKTYMNQRTLSYVFVGTAAAIWAYDIIKVAVKASRLKNHLSSPTSGYYYDLSRRAIVGTSRTGVLNTKIPYDLAMDEAAAYVSLKQYEDALASYQKALALNLQDPVAMQKITEVKGILAEIKELNDRYDSAIAKGDSLFNLKKLDKSYTAFNDASIIKPEQSYPLYMLDQIDEIRQQQKQDKEYAEKVAAGDKSFSELNYNSAKQYYTAALAIKPEEAYPKGKINETDQLIEQQRQAKVDATCEAYLKTGDYNFNNGNYSLALQYYNDAQKLKPYDPVISSKITKTQEKIRIAAQQETDSKYLQAVIDGDAAFKNKEYDKAKGFYQIASDLKPDESYPSTKITEINNILAIAKQLPEKDLATLFKECSPAVFLITLSDGSSGSGFFVSSSGIAVSNYHVYNGYGDPVITTASGSEYKVESVYDKSSDDDNDYIIFKVKNKYKINFPYLKLAGSEPEIGEDVFAIGNPHGLQNTLSNGLVSGYRGEDKYSKDYIQTTCPITHGSSGGPLFNMRGEVIGITTLGGEGAGNLGFAVNIKLLRLGRWVK